MSSRNLRNITGILLVCFIFLYLVHATVAKDTVDQLSLGWTYDADSKIRAVASGDLDNDSYDEIVAVSSRKVYILDNLGNLKKEYLLDFTPSTVFIADIDGDNVDEILIGSGWMNTSDIPGSRFEFGEGDELTEKREFLYKITRNQGDIYVIREGDEEPVKWISVGEWIRDIFVDDVVEDIGNILEDMDKDENNEILIASGGTNIDYIEMIWTEINNKTGNLTYVRNHSDEYFENGSVQVFNINGSLVSSHHTDKKVWCVHSALMWVGRGNTIFSGSKKLIAMDERGVEQWAFESLEDDCLINEILVSDIDNNTINEVMITFSCPSASGTRVGIHVLDRDGSEIWQYRITSENIYGLFSANLDIDTDQEIIIASQEGIYVLNKEGELEWTYKLTRDVTGICVTDLGNNEYADFIIASGNSILAYGINEDFIKLQIADEYYQKAVGYYDSNDHDDALMNLKNATDIYLELNNSGGVSKCNLIIEKIRNNWEKTEMIRANSMYRKALGKYHLKKYNESEDYVEGALEIYTKFGDDEGMSKSMYRAALIKYHLKNYTGAEEYAKGALEIYVGLEDREGISNCDSLLKDIEKIRDTGTMTTPTIEKTTTTLATGGVGMSSMIYVLLLVIVVVLLVFGLRQMRGKKRREEEIEGV